MIWFYLCVFLLNVIVWSFITFVMRSKRFNSPSLILAKTSDGIVIRQYVISRILHSRGKLITPGSVAKVQQAKGCLTLFQKSGAAFDIWVSRKFEAEMQAHARALFPNAEYVEV